MLLGLDAMTKMYEQESFRLASNLGLILVVSVCCMACYYSVSGDFSADGVEVIGTGYLVLWATCLVYVVV